MEIGLPDGSTKKIPSKEVRTMSDVLKLAKKELPDDGTAKMSNLLIVRAHFSEIKKNAAIGVRIVPLTSVDTKTVVPLSCLTKAGQWYVLYFNHKANPTVNMTCKRCRKRLDKCGPIEYNCFFDDSHRFCGACAKMMREEKKSAPFVACYTCVHDARKDVAAFEAKLYLGDDAYAFVISTTEDVADLVQQIGPDSAHASLAARKALPAEKQPPSGEKEKKRVAPAKKRPAHEEEEKKTEAPPSKKSKKKKDDVEESDSSEEESEEEDDDEEEGEFDELVISKRWKHDNASRVDRLKCHNPVLVDKDGRIPLTRENRSGLCYVIGRAERDSMQLDFNLFRWKYCVEKTKASRVQAYIAWSQGCFRIENRGINPIKVNDLVIESNGVCDLAPGDKITFPGCAEAILFDFSDDDPPTEDESEEKKKVEKKKAPKKEVIVLDDPATPTKPAAPAPSPAAPAAPAPAAAPKREPVSRASRVPAQRQYHAQPYAMPTYGPPYGAPNPYMPCGAPYTPASYMQPYLPPFMGGGAMYGPGAQPPVPPEWLADRDGGKGRPQFKLLDSLAAMDQEAPDDSADADYDGDREKRSDA